VWMTHGPIIIQSLDEVECEVSSPHVTELTMVTISTFLAAFVSALVFRVALGSIDSIAVTIVLFSCNLWNRKR
jgi:hypothetical protein